LTARADPATFDLHLVPHDQRRRRAGWPVERTAAVEAALAAKQVCRAEGVSWADWERGKHRPACGSCHLCRGFAASRASVGGRAGAPHRRRSAHTPTGSRSLSGTSHGANHDRARLSLPQRRGHGIPPASTRRAAVPGDAQLPAVDCRSSALSSAASLPTPSPRSRTRS
jgi:hypothetical protein